MNPADFVFLMGSIQLLQSLLIEVEPPVWAVSISLQGRESKWIPAVVLLMEVNRKSKCTNNKFMRTTSESELQEWLVNNSIHMRSLIMSRYLWGMNRRGTALSLKRQTFISQQIENSVQAVNFKGLFWMFLKQNHLQTNALMWSRRDLLHLNWQMRCGAYGAALRTNEGRRQRKAFISDYLC